MTGRPRPAIHSLPAYRPGRSAAAAEAEHGIVDAIKLASNEAPFDPLPSVTDAISAGLGQINLYPDHGAADLRTELADHLGVEVEQVTIAAGSVGLLQQLVLAYVDPGDTVATCWPSFEAYPLFALLVEANQIRVPLRDETFDLPALADAIETDTKVVFIANPNNPTGTVVGTDEIEHFLRTVPTGCLVVLDEAYHEFVTDPRVTDATALIADHPNLVITRTFSKAHGLAGLRIGYAFGHPDVIGAIDRTLVPFAVNDLAQRAARASIAATDEMRTRVADVVAERSRVVAALRSSGWTIPAPHGNFVWLPLGDLAADFGVALERHGIVTRAFPAVGVRVTVADAASNDRFITALSAAATDLHVTPR